MRSCGPKVSTHAGTTIGWDIGRQEILEEVRRRAKIVDKSDNSGRMIQINDMVGGEKLVAANQPLSRLRRLSPQA